MLYKRTKNDKAFRLIDLTASGVRKFVNFSSENQTITVGNLQALEIMKNDDTQIIIPNPNKITVLYSLTDGVLKVADDIPCQRVWLKYENSDCLYKLPVLPDGSKREFRVSGENSPKLIGDVYFMSAYSLQRG